MLNSWQVVDTTAAGDSFTSAYVVGILEGKTPEEALSFAGKKNKKNKENTLPCIIVPKGGSRSKTTHSPPLELAPSSLAVRRQSLILAVYAEHYAARAAAGVGGIT